MTIIAFPIKGCQFRAKKEGSAAPYDVKGRPFHRKGGLLF